ncbi:MAG: hypothetical protein ACE5JD_04605 [Candidatus Methylomirabilia bacterium]
MAQIIDAETGEPGALQDSPERPAHVEVLRFHDKYLFRRQSRVDKNREEGVVAAIGLSWQDNSGNESGFEIERCVVQGFGRGNTLTVMFTEIAAARVVPPDYAAVFRLNTIR